MSNPTQSERDLCDCVASLTSHVEELKKQLNTACKVIARLRPASWKGGKGE